MTICEICGGNSNRRTRLADGRLVCWRCARMREKDYEQNCIDLKNAYDYARRGWDMVTQLRKEKSISKIPKEYKYSNPISAVPPVEVLEKSMIALDVMGYFTNFSEVLADHYGFEAPRYLASDEKCDPNEANARYFWNKNLVYSPKSKPLKHRTAFHEMWHALEKHGLVPHNGDSEKSAEIYAKACLKRLGRSENS